MFVLNFLSYIYYAYFFSFVNNTGSSLSCLHPKVKGFVCRDSKSWDTFSNICLQSELLFYYLELRLVIILLIILVTYIHDSLRLFILQNESVVDGLAINI